MRVWTALIRTTYTFIVYHFCLFYQIFLKEFTFSVYIRENLRYLLHQIYHSFLDFLSPWQLELKPHHLSTVFINKTLKFKSIVFLLFAKYFHSIFPLVLFVQFLVNCLYCVLLGLLQKSPQQRSSVTPSLNDILQPTVLSENQLRFWS